MKTIIIYRQNGAGKMYLDAQGNLTSDKTQAACHWDIQFEAIIREAWIVSAGGIASFEYVDTETKWTNKAERAQIARETGYNARQHRITLLALRASIVCDCAPALNALREWDDFIASGRSLIDLCKEKKDTPLPAWARLTPPPLPVGLPMPPNVCQAPAFNV